MNFAWRRLPEHVIAAVTCLLGYKLVNGFVGSFICFFFFLMSITVLYFHHVKEHP